MSKSLERITSGHGIVTPADSPVAYAMSERFRTDLVANRARQSNVQSGISLLQTGQNAADRMVDVLNDIKGRLGEIRGGTEGGPAGPTQRRDTQIYVEELLGELGDIANTTNYNEIYLFNQARMGQTRSSFMTAFGPDMFQDNVTAHGVRDTFERFGIDNMLQDIERTFTAGMNGIGGTYQDINRTFAGGYLQNVTDTINIGDPSEIPGREVSVKLDVDAIRDVTQNFSAGNAEPVAENFTAGGIENVTDNFNVTATDNVAETFMAAATQTITDTFTFEGAVDVTQNVGGWQAGQAVDLQGAPNAGTLQVTATQTFEGGEALDQQTLRTDRGQNLVGERFGDFEVTAVNFHHGNSGKINSWTSSTWGMPRT